MRSVSERGVDSSSGMLRLFGWLFLVLVVASDASAELQLEGDYTQGGMLVGRVDPGSHLWLDGKAVPVAEDGSFVLGFARESAPSAKLRVRGADGREQRRTLSIDKREFRVQRIDGLPERKVTPRSKEDLARIRREAEAVRKARSMQRTATDFRQDFIWPVTGRISGVYGSQRILNGKPRRPHMGVDIARPTGTTVVAPADGKVVLAQSDLFFSGGTLIIDHGMRMNTSYLHLSRLLVEEGERVTQGQPIAEVGATGRVTGPHLHWGANVRDVRIDPQLLVPPMPSTASR